MKPLRFYLPLFVIALLSAIALLHGAIPQPSGYHDFADRSTILGIAHFGDVASNLGFALVAIWGWRHLRLSQRHPGIAHGRSGYRLFLLGLSLTAFGSAYYHLAPGNARLVWDRIPIALACAGLLAGVWGDTQRKDSAAVAPWLMLVAVISVAWWHFTEMAGYGDLRPYLLLQGLPFLLIPLWQWLYDAPRHDRSIFGLALLIYVLAKFAELSDHAIAHVFGLVTGHTLKHLLATAAAALIVIALVRRVQSPKSVAQDKDQVTSLQERFVLSFRF